MEKKKETKTKFVWIIKGSDEDELWAADNLETAAEMVVRYKEECCYEILDYDEVLQEMKDREGYAYDYIDDDISVMGVFINHFGV